MVVGILRRICIGKKFTDPPTPLVILKKLLKKFLTGICLMSMNDKQTSKYLTLTKLFSLQQTFNIGIHKSTLNLQSHEHKKMAQYFCSETCNFP